MTTFIAWVGVDSRGPASVYFASDSRISWPDNSVWDNGRKLFASHISPDLLGYVGDVLFPSLVLAQITSAIDGGVMFGNDTKPFERFQQIRTSIRASFEGFPKSQRQTFTIVYATREGVGRDCSFHFFTLNWHPTKGWSEEIIPISQTSSGLLRILGSGETSVLRWQEYWDSSSQGRTSRSIFSAFCDALRNGSDAHSGGAPQLVGMYRKGVGKVFGVVMKGQPFLFGIPLSKEVAQASQGIQWHNTVFERCDAKGLLLQNTKEHWIPKGLGLFDKS